MPGSSGWRIGGLRFAPSRAITLVTLLLLPLLVALGFWQLDRAAQKEALEKMYRQRASDAPVRLDRTVTDAGALRYRQVQLRGRFDAGHTVLRDNAVHAGRAGYEVLTPLQTEPDGLWVLVNRGWIPQGSTRARLPEITTPDHVVELRGLIDLPPERGLLLGEGQTPGWPKVVQYVDLEQLSWQMGYPLQPYWVRLDPDARDGFARDWRLGSLGKERHQAYAFQWFALAGALLIIYMVVSLSRDAGHER